MSSLFKEIATSNSDETNIVGGLGGFVQGFGKSSHMFDVLKQKEIDPYRYHFGQDGPSTTQQGPFNNSHQQPFTNSQQDHQGPFNNSQQGPFTQQGSFNNPRHPFTNSQQGPFNNNNHQQGQQGPFNNFNQGPFYNHHQGPFNNSRQGPFGRTV